MVLYVLNYQINGFEDHPQFANWSGTRSKFLYQLSDLVRIKKIIVVEALSYYRNTPLPTFGHIVNVVDSPSLPALLILAHLQDWKMQINLFRKV